MTATKLRAAVPADAPFLTSVTLRLGGVPLPPWRTAAEVAAADLRQMLAALHDPHARFLLLIAETTHNDPLGCVFATIEGDFFTGRPGAHVEVLAVRAEAEGKGVARLLLEAAEDWARQQGFDHVTLNVLVGNAHARAVYERIGYGAESVRYRKSL